MRSSTIVAAVALAVVAPALAAPVANPASYARRATTSTTCTAAPVTTAVAPIDESGAISLGTIASIASFAAPVIGGIINHFKNNGNQQQRRDALELEALLARDDADESGALKLSTVASIGSFVAPVIGGIISHFTNNGNQQQRRQALELQDLLAREPGRLGDAATIAEFASTAVSAVHDYISSHKQRDLSADESGALKLGDVANIASIGSSLISAGESIFGNHKRDLAFEELLARAATDVDESGALKLGDVANIASIGGSIISAVHNLFGQRDESGALFLGHGPVCIRAPCPGSNAFHPIFTTAIARDDVTDESGALKLGDVANVASIGSSLVSAFHSIFGGQKRDLALEELFAREIDNQLEESGALKLGDVANVASIGSSLVSAFHNIFGGQKRDLALEELFAREIDNQLEESGALKLGDVANVASIGSSLVSAFHNIFGGQKRDLAFEELLARAVSDVDESGALKLGDVANVASIGSSLVSAFHNIFGGQKRDLAQFEELFARSMGSINDLD